ncbi:hypothetical protein TKK_0003711 [Trichogramma kaykai]|uniref:Ankyrin repeat protein n=1 Tax=Trichogramma kaykai TaxID=54128 RepID=A0ABD2XP64_9HYME
MSDDDDSSTDPCRRHELKSYACVLYSHDDQMQFWQLCHDGKALCAEILLRSRRREIDVDLACRDTGRPWCACSRAPPLLVAADKRSYAVIGLLLGHGARVDARDESGRTALHLLSRLSSWWRIDEQERFDRHAEAVGLLAGCCCCCSSEPHRLDALDEDGRSPMFHLFEYESGNDYAERAKRVRRRQLRLLRLLLHSGAEATIVDRRGKSLLHCVADWRGPLASYHRNDHYGAAMAQSLCEHGARVNLRLGGASSGATALELAVRNLNYAVARVLVANGAEAPDELLDYRRYFPVGGTDVVNADTIVRTYYVNAAAFEELRAPRIAKMLDFLERTPSIKSVEGFNALIKWGECYSSMTIFE